MAYISQETKKKLSPEIKRFCKEYGVKATISIEDYSTLVVTLKTGTIDFENSMISPHHSTHNGMLVVCSLNEDNFSGKAGDFFKDLRKAMTKGCDYLTDDTDQITLCGWYEMIKIGTNDKPYLVK